MVVYYAICVFERGFLFLGITLFRCDKILNCDMIYRPPARPRPQMQRKTKDQLHTALVVTIDSLKTLSAFPIRINRGVTDYNFELKIRALVFRRSRH